MNKETKIKEVSGRIIALLRQEINGQDQADISAAVIARVLEDQCNSFCWNSTRSAEIIVNEIRRMHRTLQQTVVSTLLHVIKEYGDTVTIHNQDLRNQYVSQKCAEIANEIEITKEPLI